MKPSNPLSRLCLMAVLAMVSTQSLAADGAAVLVADGQPWSSTTSDGHKMKITFFRDGRAKMHFGFMSKSMTWNATKDGFCLMGLPQGKKCLRLEKTDNGYIGYEEGGLIMTLTR